MIINDAVKNTWKSVTLTKNEIWFCWSGAIQIDTDPDEAQRLGLMLTNGVSAPFSAGLTVYYKLPLNKYDTALVARVAVSI